MSGRESAPPEVIEAVDNWNARYPVGTPVLFWPGVRHGEVRKSKTRTPAWVIHGGHSALVSVEDYSGGIILSHVEPVIAASVLPEGWRWDAPIGGVRGKQCHLYSSDGALRGSIERTDGKGWEAAGRYNGWFLIGYIADETEARAAVERAVVEAVEAAR